MTTTSIRAWSPQQLAFFSWVQWNSGNAIVVAVAGSGKSTSIIEACVYARGKIVILAFNRKIANEMQDKANKAGLAGIVEVKTFHALGLRAWSKVAPFAQVEETKLEILMEKYDTPKHLRGFTKKLVSLAKQNLCAPGDWKTYDRIIDHFDLEDSLYNEFTPDVEHLRQQGTLKADELFRASIECCDKIIDYDDMIHAPLYHRIEFPKYDWVFVDEAQDTNNARRQMAVEILADNGRFVAVGDPRQAIYGFTGADADALDLIQNDFAAQELPLTVSFRCAKAVVRHAQKVVSHIEAAPGAPEGSVREISDAEFIRIIPDPSDAILCRLNKPLVQMALAFIRRRIAAHVEGRDIGQSLLSLIRKWKSVTTVEDLRDKLGEYREKESAKFLEKNQGHKIGALDDKIESLYAIMDTLADDDSVGEVARVVSSLFQDTEGRPIRSITLSSVHKAKGREWDRVYLYGRNKWMPFKMAKQDWELLQENNLIYVAITRAKRELIEVRVGGEEKEANEQ